MKSKRDPIKSDSFEEAFPFLRAMWGVLKDTEAFRSPFEEESVNPDFFVPDHTSASDDHLHRDTVFYLGLKHAANLEKPQEMACMYASAMSAFAPDLEDVFLSLMNHLFIFPLRIFIPSQANARGIALNELQKYGPDETLVLFGTCLRILFMKIDVTQEAKYKRFVTKSLNELGSTLGMSEEALSRLKFPLTLKKARAVKSVFCFKSIQAKIITYLMSVSKQTGNLSVVASRMCEMLAWSEMFAFVCIKDVFHATGSPVLQDSYVKHEVSAFYYAMKKVYKSEHPQFFYYFCSASEEVYLDKSNFPVLAEAARKCMLEMIPASSSAEQFGANPKARSPSGLDGSVGKS